MKSARITASWSLFALMFLATIAFAQQETGDALPAKNVILLIGDGMGQEQIDAASLYLTGNTGQLAFEDPRIMPYRARMTTRSADNRITDSAASGTAMATGQKTNNGVVSQSPTGVMFATVLEHFAKAGKSTGLVTTAEMPDATPAVFAAHQDRRGSWNAVFADYMNPQGARPTLLLGGAGGPDDHNKRNNGSGVLDIEQAKHLAQAAGYEVVTNRVELDAVDMNRNGLKICGLFGQRALPYEFDYAKGRDHGYDTLPHLTQMTQAALKLLEKNPKGLFLMVEGERIDHVGHGKGIADLSERTLYSVQETLEFSRAFEVVMAWARGRSDTLIILTADHETGAMKIIQGKGVGQAPEAIWSSTSHTATPVPVYAWGVGAEQVRGQIDNTDIYRVMMRQLVIPVEKAP